MVVAHMNRAIGHSGETKMEDIPVLYRDGIHDDTAALQAMADLRPVMEHLTGKILYPPDYLHPVIDRTEESK